MIDALLTAVAQSPPVEVIAGSRHLYGMLRSAHVVGLAILYGSIFALDLRLLGLFREVPAQPLARTLPFVATGGLALAILSGLVLFSIAPQDYLDEPVFLTKMGFVGLGLVHTVAINFMPEWKALMRDGSGMGPRLRAAAILSLALWTSAIVCGRLIAFTA